MTKINIAIDGFSSCGKSTLAKDLAKEVGYLYLDTGAMYRCVTLFAMRNKLVGQNGLKEDELVSNLNNIDISFQVVKKGTSAHAFLNGADVEQAIRTMEVASNVSEVSTVKEVRSFLVAQQQKIAKDKGVVMDGRDIGTVVLPEAELKIFMTASDEVRAKRRLLELEAKGDEVSFEAVLENLKKRDLIDSTRKESPLKQAEDAVLLDNSNLTKSEQFELVMSWFREKTK